MILESHLDLHLDFSYYLSKGPTPTTALTLKTNKQKMSDLILYLFFHSIFHVILEAMNFTVLTSLKRIVHVLLLSCDHNIT